LSFARLFSFSLYISRNFISLCFSRVMPGDLGNVAGSDLTLCPDDRGLCTKSNGEGSGIGGGGGALYAEYVESRDFGLRLGARDTRSPEGKAAEFELFDAGRDAVAGLGPSFTFGLYSDSSS
jgi:hypothetical protein